MDSKEMRPGFFVDILEDCSTASADLSSMQKERNDSFAAKFAHACSCLNAGGAAKWAQVEGKAIRKKAHPEEDNLHDVAKLLEAEPFDFEEPPVFFNATSINDNSTSNRGTLSEDIK